MAAEGKPYLAHRVALLLDGRPPREGQLVRHLCGTPACQNPRHLLAGTHGENMQDRTEAGNDPAGERNGRARLSWQDVAAIRASPRTRGMQTRLAREYGVSVATINLILHGKTWWT